MLGFERLVPLLQFSQFELALIPRAARLRERFLHHVQLSLRTLVIGRQVLYLRFGFLGRGMLGEQLLSRCLQFLFQPVMALLGGLAFLRALARRRLLVMLELLTSVGELLG